MTIVSSSLDNGRSLAAPIDLAKFLLYRYIDPGAACDAPPEPGHGSLCFARGISTVPLGQAYQNREPQPAFAQHR